jgi:hypothetical protein
MGFFFYDKKTIDCENSHYDISNRSVTYTVVYVLARQATALKRVGVCKNASLYCIIYFVLLYWMGSVVKESAPHDKEKFTK